MNLAACASSAPTRARTPTIPTEPVLRITHQAGGTHYRTLVHEDVWFQTFGSELLVLEPRSARLLHTLALGRIGETGAATEMVVHDEQLYIVLDSDAVVVVSIDDPRRPRVVDRRAAAELGVRPRRLSVVEGELFVSGGGGVVRWADGARLYRHLGEAGRVVASDHGLVTSVGRRIYRLEDGQFVGVANDLLPAAALDNEDSQVDLDRAVVFMRQSPEGAIVGLMGPDLRELDSRLLTVAVPGQVQTVRIFEQRLWVVSDSEITTYEVEGNRLARRMLVDVLGARDVARTDEHHLAVAGSFGRALYRIHSTERGPGDTFIHTHREPSRLSRAKTDDRFILAGSDEGVWLYLIGSRVELSRESLDRGDAPRPPSTQASVAGARARISEDGMTLSITSDAGVFDYVEPDGARIKCVVSVEDEFWIGHERGITVLKPHPSGSSDGATLPATVTGTLRIDGPVRYLYPLRVGRGVAFVSEFGGFGAARWVDEPIEAQARK